MNRLFLFFTVLPLPLFAAAPTVESVVPPGLRPPGNPTLPVALKDVEWQALPVEVRNVTIGPDGRTWYDLQGRVTYHKVPLQKVKASIEEQFRSALPQVFATPVLFEAGGRVWFVSDHGRIFLGYDGKTWTEPQAPIRLACWGRTGGVRDPQSHCYFAGHAFFLTGTGVHTFDGAKWSFQEMYEPRNGLAGLYILPEQKQVLACIGGPQPAIWRWQDGNWHQEQVPASNASYVAPWTSGRIWVNTFCVAQLLQPGSKEPDYPRLLEELKAARDEPSRNSAIERAVVAGPGMFAHVQKALATTYDTTLVETLTTVLKRLRQGQTFALDGYELKDPRLVLIDTNLWAFVMSPRVKRGDTFVGAGCVVFRPEGGATFIPEAQGVWNHKDISAPLILANGLAAWLPSLNSEAKATLVDLKSGRVLGQVPEAGLGYIHAVRSDGTVFISSDAVNADPIMVYRPKLSMTTATKPSPLN